MKTAERRTMIPATLGLVFVLTIPRYAISQIQSGNAPLIAPSEVEQLFLQRVQPLLSAKCLPCHGNDQSKLKSQLDLSRREGMLKGGKRGPAIVPGEPANSRLYVAVTWKDEELQMPPKRNDRLNDEQVDWIRQWIAAGAHWPAATSTSDSQTLRQAGEWKQTGAGGVLVKTSGGLSEEWNNRRYKPEDLWAYRPIRRPTMPSGEWKKPANPIDAFILHRQKAEEITQAAPRADKLTLIRRATFDLTGLPPQPQQVDQFLNDNSPGALMRLVQRLLDSPHYGEQQARHWLDVVRYADTSGFSNDYERPNAWRYRDYVIRSFNKDKSYDRFIMEQIAGDELDPGNPELLIAAGFLRLGPWEQTSMTVAALTRQHFLDDVTHHVGVTFLAQGLRCASCHDHKFDPIPTRDYYRMQAVFASTQFAERMVPFLPFENSRFNEKAKAITQQRLDETRSILAAFTRKNRDAIAGYLTEKGVIKFEDLPLKDRPNKGEFGLTKEELTLKKIAQKRRDYFERELKRFEPYAFSLYSGPPNRYTSQSAINAVPDKLDGVVPAVRILHRGVLDAPGDEVTPGVLSAVFDLSDRESPYTASITHSDGGRRLALANWIASPRNPLTARVIVNRIWQQHFGRGIVSTPNNFGKMGGKPTHPELLDWLAHWFMENGWSLKKLHALIMSSETYQQSGSHPEMEKIGNVDPRNELLAYFPSRRLAAEEIRDAMLFSSGELNPEPGGPGVFPEINWEVAFQPRHIMGSVAPAYLPSPTPDQRNRRTIYTFRYRTLSDPLLEVFNRPGTEVSCERRDQTTVTPQVFALFNSQFARNRALAMAAALEKRAAKLSDQIEQAFRLFYGRFPTTGEKRLAEKHVKKMEEFHRQHSPEKSGLAVSVERHMVEEMTGEDVRWTESLDALKSYQRDVMPWDAMPHTRALAELCLVMFNSNEFLYVR